MNRHDLRRIAAISGISAASLVAALSQAQGAPPRELIYPERPNLILPDNALSREERGLLQKLAIIPGLGFVPAFGGGDAAGPTVVYCGTTLLEFGGTSGTVSASNVPIGVASATRRLLCVVSGYTDNFGIDGVTIGGTSYGTIAAGANSLGAVKIAYNSTIRSAGTTMGVSITQNGGATEILRLSIYALYDLTATSEQTSGNFSHNSAASVSLDANGIMIAGAWNSPGTAATWTNATEDYDSNGSSAASRLQAVAGSTNITVASSATNFIGRYVTFK